MAILINETHAERCPCCGGQDGSTRVAHSFCYAGSARRLLERNPDGTWRFPSVGASDATHAVSDPGLTRTGWFLRGGRLPICPEHQEEGDVPL
jgi:hypothetical protein